MRRSKRESKLRVTGLCAGNSPVTGEFPAQKAGEAENVSIFPFDDVIMYKGNDNIINNGDSQIALSFILNNGDNDNNDMHMGIYVISKTMKYTWTAWLTFNLI